MRFDSSITAVSWIPSGWVTGLAKLPFAMGMTHYDERPPERLGDIEAWTCEGRIREVNRLHAWIEVDGGRIVDGGYASRSGLVGSTAMNLGFTRLRVAGAARPLIRRRPFLSTSAARFFQTVGGRTGVPFPRVTTTPPFVAWNSSTAWTTLVLSLDSHGRAEGLLLGASPVPRHLVLY